jgi:hypothetical protein
VLKIQLIEINIYWWFNYPQSDSPPGPFIDPLLLIQQPLTVECRRGRLAGFIRVDISTRREPSAFEQNTGYCQKVHIELFIDEMG